MIINSLYPSKPYYFKLTRPIRHTKSHWHLNAASQDPSKDDNPPPVDIDALAAKLSAEAERLRASETPSPAVEDILAPMGFSYQEERESRTLQVIGDGGFFSSDFELLQELGRISVHQQQAASSSSLYSMDDDYEYDNDDANYRSLTPGSTTQSSQAAVIAYTAAYTSGMPFQDPVITLIKEYLPGAVAVAVNELAVLKHLTSLPDRTEKWKVAATGPASMPPVIRLLGYFKAGISESAQSLILSSSSSSGTSSSNSTTNNSNDNRVYRDMLSQREAIWVVSKWEGMAPLTLWPSTQQTSGIGLGRLFGDGGGAAALRDRVRMIKSITKGSLYALAYCHNKGVIHGAVGSGSVLLSSFDDKAAGRLLVKLDNFGFAKRISLPSGNSGYSSSDTDTDSSGRSLLYYTGEDTPYTLGCRGDLRQLAVVLLEAAIGALADGGPSPATSAESFQRLLGEVFDWDVDRFKEYCEGEEEWNTAVQVLSLKKDDDDGSDDGSGWGLLKGMVSGKMPAEILVEHPFCDL
jgi:serine/threonine protein kinase